MFIDNLLRVSAAQAFPANATTVSTNSIDQGNVTPKRQIGTGVPMGFGISIDVALAGGASMQVDVISTTDAALTAGLIVHSSRVLLLADVVAGALFFIDVPDGTPTQRFLGLRVILGAGITVTFTAQLTAADLWSIASVSYAKNFTA